MSDVVVATSLDEAQGALADHPDATVLAGGTDLMVEINRGLRRPSCIVGVAQVPELRQWSIAEDRVIVGGGVTYTEMMTTPLADAAPALAQAARTVGSPPIRNAGTLGGNLGTASPAGDTLPVLAALNAQIVVVGPDGERRMGMDEFVVGVKRTSLRPGELIVAAELDRPSGRQEFLKIGPPQRHGDLHGRAGPGGRPRCPRRALRNGSGGRRHSSGSRGGGLGGRAHRLGERGRS